jgi:hypothetical protein
MGLYSADMVIGSKRHPQSKVDYPLLRRFLSSVYQLLIKKLFNLDVTDTQVGLKLFRREVIESIREDLELDRYGFDLELLALAARKGYTQVLEAPVRLDYFSRNIRSPGQELIHVFRVGSLILKDTWNLYRRLRQMPIPKQASGKSTG